MLRRRQLTTNAHATTRNHAARTRIDWPTVARPLTKAIGSAKAAKHQVRLVRLASVLSGGGIQSVLAVCGADFVAWAGVF